MTAIFAAHLFGQEATGDTPIGATFTLSAFWVLIIGMLLIPVATGLITKANASATVKQIVTLVISAVVSIISISRQETGIAVVSWNTVVLIVVQTLAAIATYLGVYKPHELNAKTAPAVGIGGTKAA